VKRGAFGRLARAEHIALPLALVVELELLRAGLSRVLRDRPARVCAARARIGPGLKRRRRHVPQSKAAHVYWSETAKGKVHSLRHTGISRAANHPAIPLVHVRDFARRADLATTQGYVHKIENEKVTTALGEALAGTD
jgi:integrase